MTIYGIILKIFLGENKINLLELARPFLKQHADHLKAFGKQHRLAFLILIVGIIWITMTTIISHCFSCSLLMTYFKTKPVKIVDSMEDVLANSKLNVASHAFTLDLVQWLMSKDRFDELMKNVINYQSKVNIKVITSDIKLATKDFINKQVLTDVLKGKTVLIVGTSLKRKMLENWPDFNLKSAQDKRFINYLTLKISKNSKYSKEINDL